MVTTGKVKWFDDKKGFGFIEMDDGSGDVFIHYTAIQTDGFRTLTKGQQVEFEIVQAAKGRQATSVREVRPSGGPEGRPGTPPVGTPRDGGIREPYSGIDPMEARPGDAPEGKPFEDEERIES